MTDEKYESALKKVSVETLTGYAGIPDFYCGAGWAREYTLKAERTRLLKRLKPLFEAHDKAKGKIYVLQGNPNLAYDFIESISTEIEKLKALRKGED